MAPAFAERGHISRARNIHSTSIPGIATTATLSYPFPHHKPLTCMQKTNANVTIAEDHMLLRNEHTNLIPGFENTNQANKPKGTIKNFINLNARELEFLKFACTEMTYKEIAEKMYLSVRTIDGYRDALFEKLSVKSRVGLVLYAIKNNIVNLG
jgi:DNA-binding CsgD family transcriptional regulator